MNDSLKLYVEKITNLPSLPAIAQKIIALADDDLISVNKLESIIGNDPAISAKVLSVANSAFYGFHTPAKTLRNAIMRIGFNSVKNIALGISIMTVLNAESRHITPDYERVFNHSVVVAFISRLLSKRFKFSTTDEIIISGILHDIGMLVLSRYFHDDYLEVMNVFAEGKSLTDAEKEVFSFSHADIGNWIAVRWHLPDTVCDTVLHHHLPSGAAGDRLQIATVHVADHIADTHVFRATSQDYVSPLDPSSLAVLGMSRDDLNDISAEIKNGSFFNDLFKT
ncbi:MAG: HDOD domain-containing protein [Nitrospirota bacterium]